MFVSHRVNTIKELIETPTDVGVEIDIRVNNNHLILSHDPFIEDMSKIDHFEDYISEFNHAFIILNIKTDGIELEVLRILKKYDIKNYFFLDCSFPTIYKLSRIHNEKNIALRFSEYESIDSIILMKNKADWVWVDCFNKFPLNYEYYCLLKAAGFKICIVSPELQNQPEKLIEYRDYMLKWDIIPDMVCSKIKNRELWSPLCK